MSIKTFIFKNKEYIKFLIYFIILIIFTPSLLNLSIRSGEHGLLMGQITQTIYYINPAGIQVLITFFTGFYVGSLLLMFVDRKKRMQAILLSISIIILVIYISKGIIFSNIHWSKNIEWPVFGIFVGFVLGGGLGILRGGTEFKWAARNISVVLAGLIIFVFFNYHLSPYIENNINTTIGDVVVVSIFIYFFKEFAMYTFKGPKLFMFGPANSGKSLFMAGCYLEASAPVNPSDDLLELIDELHTIRIDWPKHTTDVKDHHFTYEYGSLFIKNILFKMIDYPGPYLEKINEYMDKKEDKNEKNEKIFAKLAQDVKKSDKLIFIIDGEKYPDFDQMGIIEYIKILKKMPERKIIDSCVVITKCDLFVDEYKDKEKNEDPENDYNNFKKFISNKFIHDIRIQQLLRVVGDVSIYPVFYYTEQVDKNKRKPMRDYAGNVFTFGFSELIDDMLK